MENNQSTEKKQKGIRFDLTSFHRHATTAPTILRFAMFVRGEARDATDPKPGFYAMKLCRGGPVVAAEITFENGLWGAKINGEPVGEPCADWACQPGVNRIFPYCREIPESEALFLIERYRWHRDNDPEHPFAHPERPINLATLAPIGMKK